MTRTRSLEAAESPQDTLQVVDSEAQFTLLSVDNLSSLLKRIRVLAALVYGRKIRKEVRPAAVRCPTEVLSLIFRLAGEPHRKPSWVTSNHFVDVLPDIRSILAVSHVCSWWRAVSIEDQLLWRNISSIEYSSRLARLLLKRSGLMPLRVFMRPAPGDKRIIVDPFVDRPRIQELTLMCSKHHTYPVLSDVLVPLSQSLEYLNILGHIPSDPSMEQQPLRQPLFPDATAPPVLKALSLDATMLSTDHYPMLLHLQITGRHPDPSDLLTFLRGTPLLQTLHVHSMSQSEHSRTRSQPGPSRVRLDHLRALCLDFCGVPVSDISSLFRGLSIPTDAMIQVHRIQLRNASDLHGLELPHLYSEGIYTELEVAEGLLSRRLHFRARGARASLWVDIELEGIDRATVDVVRPDIIRAMLANLPLALSTVETLRIAGMSSSFERHLLAHVVSAVEEYRIPISSLVVASYNHKRRLGKYLREGLVDNGDISDLGVFQSIHDVGELLDMAKSRSSLQRPLSSITFSAPDALPRAVEGSWDVAVLEHHVGEVQFSSRRLWHLDSDKFWKAENEFWPMYPHERNIESRRGLPCLDSNW
ncbi:hypothetical protein C8Q74DRAFT_1366020 [Fomes fomentarius]|nr:hypothetical protein C8Q74DRAFT_1366020 [Fomes fomentarius]